MAKARRLAASAAAATSAQGGLRQRRSVAGPIPRRGERSARPLRSCRAFSTSRPAKESRPARQKHRRPRAGRRQERGRIFCWRRESPFRARRAIAALILASISPRLALASVWRASSSPRTASSGFDLQPGSGQALCGVGAFIGQRRRRITRATGLRPFRHRLDFPAANVADRRQHRGFHALEDFQPSDRRSIIGDLASWSACFEWSAASGSAGGGFLTTARLMGRAPRVARILSGVKVLDKSWT